MTKCRHCKKELNIDFLDLGYSPPSNSYRSGDDLNAPELYYPLRVQVCDSCWLVQTQDFVQADLMFEEQYAYFSSTSKSWLKHARDYSENIIERLSLDRSSFVIEIASNDGYLLKNFVEIGIPCLGIEPTIGTAKASQQLGVDVVTEFFTEKLASKLISDSISADLLIGNNVYAHVPDINDFTKGMKTILSPNGVITLEFPHLLNLMEFNQFDTVYHEHFSYLSLHSVSKIFQHCELKVFDIEHISTHGGSIRIFGCHEDSEREVSSSVYECLEREEEFGLTSKTMYESFQVNANKIKNDLLTFLIDCRKNNRTVVAYGAAAKGNTLLNYSGIKTDLIEFVCDASAAKQGKYMPGSHIPIYDPIMLDNIDPDYVIILPWNLADEITQQLNYLRDKGVKFVTAVPELKIF